MIGDGIVRFYLWGVCGGGLVGAGDLLRNVKGLGGEFRGGRSFFRGGGFFFGGGDGCAVFFLPRGRRFGGVGGFCGLCCVISVCWVPEEDFPCGL